jgi:multisubunit Na+/H+ antiporter MnhB subunit
VTDHARLKKRLVQSAWLVLAGGAVASAAIYLTAATNGQNSLQEGFRGSKVYRHELEAYGGKLSLVSDELTSWFASLWQGETLAFTVAAIAADSAFLLLWLARRIPSVTKG